MAMNSVNSSAIASGELECMLTLAELHISGMKMQDAMNAVQSSAPVCKNYLEDVWHYCKLFSGGPSFPLLKCLDCFCTLSFQ